MYKCPLCKTLIKKELDKNRPIDIDMLKECIKRLFPREWVVLRKLYCCGEHVSALAHELEILQVSVLDIENDALGKLVRLFRKYGRPTNRQEVKEAIVINKKGLVDEEIVHHFISMQD